MATSTFAATLGVPYFRAFDANGDPLSGGRLETYLAGTSTPVATYPTYADALAGTNANTNPVILSSEGTAQIFVQVGFLKYILKDSAGVTVPNGTVDNVALASGAPYPAVTEWLDYTTAPIVFFGATSFSVTGVDATAILHAGRRIKTVNSGGTVYSTIRNSSFAVNTTVSVVNDGASVLDAGLSALAYGIVSYANDSYLDPRSFFTAIKSGNQTGFAASTKVATWTVERDNLSEWVAGTNRWVCKYPGQYIVMFSAEHSNTVASINAVAQIDKNAAVVAQAVGRAYSVAANITSLTAHFSGLLAAGDFIEGFFLGDANTTVVGSAGTRLTVYRIA